MTNGEVMDFIDSNPFDVNDAHGWIRFIEDLIVEFNFKSVVYEDPDEGHCIEVYTPEEDLISNILYDVEESKISLHYIFSGNVSYFN